MASIDEITDHDNNSEESDDAVASTDATDMVHVIAVQKLSTLAFWVGSVCLFPLALVLRGFDYISSHTLSRSILSLGIFMEPRQPGLLHSLVEMSTFPPKIISFAMRLQDPISHMYWAAKDGYTRTLQQFLAQANPNSYEKAHLIDVLRSAVRAGHVGTVEMLLSRPEFPLHILAERFSGDYVNYMEGFPAILGHLEVLKVLLDYKEHLCEGYARRILFDAAERGHTDIVAFALTLPNCFEGIFKSYHLGIDNSYHLDAAALKGHVEIVRLLLNHPDCPVVSVGLRALPSAAREGHLEVVKLLLHHPDIKPQINFPDGDNETPILLALLEGHADMVELLFEHGAVLPPFDETRYPHIAEVANIIYNTTRPPEYPENLRYAKNILSTLISHSVILVFTNVGNSPANAYSHPSKRPISQCIVPDVMTIIAKILLEDSMGAQNFDYVLHHLNELIPENTSTSLDKRLINSGVIAQNRYLAREPERQVERTTKNIHTLSRVMFSFWREAQNPADMEALTKDEVKEHFSDIETGIRTAVNSSEDLRFNLFHNKHYRGEILNAAKSLQSFEADEIAACLVNGSSLS